MQHHTSPHEEQLKRSAIEWAYVQLKNPSDDEWGGKGGTVVAIREFLRLPQTENRLHQVPVAGYDSLDSRQGSLTHSWKPLQVAPGLMT